MSQSSKIIVAFHTGRGGRFYNPGHVSFIGEKNFQDLISLNSNNLFEQNRDKKGRFCKPYMTDCSGKVVVEPGHIQDEVGCLDFDGSYDTDSCGYVEDCTEEELCIIFDSGNWISPELREYLKNHFEEVGDESRLEETSHRYGW